MHIAAKSAVRILLLLLVIAVVLLAGAELVGRGFGDRVYLLNDTACTILVSEEHDGTTLNPGETALIKSGMISRTPSILIATKSGIMFGGLHFLNDRLQARGVPDIAVPFSFREESIFGSKLTYELNVQGQIVVRNPPGMASSMPQPPGLPLRSESGSACTNG